MSLFQGQTETLDGSLVTQGTLNGHAAMAIAASNVVGGSTVIFRFDLAAAALASTDIVTTYAIRVIDAYLVLRGGGVGSTTITVKNSTTAITDAMAASGSDKAATVYVIAHRV